MGARYKAGLVARFKRVCERAWSAVGITGRGRVNFIDWRERTPFGDFAVNSESKTWGLWVAYSAKFDDPQQFGVLGKRLSFYLSGFAATHGPGPSMYIAELVTTDGDAFGPFNLSSARSLSVATQQAQSDLRDRGEGVLVSGRNSVGEGAKRIWLQVKLTDYQTIMVERRDAVPSKSAVRGTSKRKIGTRSSVERSTPRKKKKGSRSTRGGKKKRS